MAATEGSNFLTSRSCLVPINRAMTLSMSFATSMEFSLFPVTADRAGRNPAVEVRPTGTVYSICLDALAPNGEQRDPSWLSEEGQRAVRVVSGIGGSSLDPARPDERAEQ